MISARNISLAIRYLGPRWFARRALYAARRRLGGLERSMPRRAWSDVPASIVALQSPPRVRSLAKPAEADYIASGRFRFFSDRLVEVGLPPQWHRNHVTGETVPADAHWSRIGDFSFGDIKDVWELSRFAWAYDLALVGDEKAAGLFWRLFEDWMAHNPPNSGPNWMCGQEAAIRLMAVIFAIERFGLTAQQEGDLARFVAATGERIEANLDYALAQQNNHGISECVGLLTSSLLIPSHPSAKRWCTRALRELQRQVAELVYADGAFSQHSLIYHRVALHQLCWASLRLRGAGIDEPAWLKQAGTRQVEFLAAITDAETGDAPLFGANDGANILPLASCAFGDMRPAVQLGGAVFQQFLRYHPGPWDAAAMALVQGADQLPRRSIPLQDWSARDGGLVQLAQRADRLVMRCPERFRHRPSQADFGHVDIWLGGQRVAMDGGSFSYNSRERFTELGSARQHNAVTRDGIEPMHRATRFLYVPWPGGKLQESDDGWTYEPDLFGDSRVRWKRHVAKRPGGGFVVRDSISGAQRHAMRWHWRLVDAAWRQEPGRLQAEIRGRTVVLLWQFSSECAAEVVRADARSATGWHAPHYGRAEPAVSVVWRMKPAADIQAKFEFFVL